MFPDKSKAFQENFNDATALSYNYLFPDLRPDSCESLRMRTRIFPGDIYYACELR